MAIFKKIFSLYKKRGPVDELKEEYIEINLLAQLVNEKLISLRKLQKKIVQANIAIAKGKSTGGIGLSKTLFIKEDLIPKIKQLALITESRFEHTIKGLEKEEPIVKDEKKEMQRIISFLKELQSFVPDLNDIASKNRSEQLRIIEMSLREITNLAKEFHQIEKYELDLISRVLENEISPLLNEIYSKSKVKKGVYIYKLTKNQLKKLQQESKKINQQNDPKFKIIWRRWWRDNQKPEVDKTTDLKDPHINVTIKLFGKKKKEIHLLLAA